MKTLTLEIEKFIEKISLLEFRRNPQARLQVLKMRRLIRQMNLKL